MLANVCSLKAVRGKKGEGPVARAELLGRSECTRNHRLGVTCHWSIQNKIFANVDIGTPVRHFIYFAQLNWSHKFPNKSLAIFFQITFPLFIVLFE